MVGFGGEMGVLEEALVAAGVEGGGGWGSSLHCFYFQGVRPLSGLPAER